MHNRIIYYEFAWDASKQKEKITDGEKMRTKIKQEKKGGYRKVKMSSVYNPTVLTKVINK